MPSYRNKGAMAEQIPALLSHYADAYRTMSVNDLIELAIGELYRRELGSTEEASIIGWDRFVLAQEKQCGDTGTTIPAGAEAWREVWSDGRRGAILSRESLIADGVL